MEVNDTYSEHRLSVSCLQAKFELRLSHHSVESWSMGFAEIEENALLINIRCLLLVLYQSPDQTEQNAKNTQDIYKLQNWITDT